MTIWLVMRLGRRWFNPEAGWWAGSGLCHRTIGGIKAFQAEALLLSPQALESLVLPA